MRNKVAVYFVVIVVVLQFVFVGVPMNQVYGEMEKKTGYQASEIQATVKVKGNGDASISQLWKLGEKTPSEIILFFEKEDSINISDFEAYLIEETDTQEIKESVEEESSGYGYKKSDASGNKRILETGLRRLDIGEEYFIKVPEEIKENSVLELKYNHTALVKNYKDGDAGLYRFIWSNPSFDVDTIQIRFQLLDKEQYNFWMSAKAKKGVDYTVNEKEKIVTLHHLKIQDQLNVKIQLPDGLMNANQRISDNSSVLKVGDFAAFTKETMQREDFAAKNYNLLLVLVGLLVIIAVLKILIDSLSLKRISIDTNDELSDTEEKENEAESRKEETNIEESYLYDMEDLEKK